ncbi:nuclear transport factor 2 family protein [Longimicrobium terrae]|uniref:SnoaL-like domain-containing protein n=1 Tax=Longimicrobium terrae TaxID=1639882 RepID=A0A841H2B6_9BACT|nr:nuclear transport factor 2 family protein [Longimicrobium terrae]MBB4637717.1 hypothetical protein [Longimicrobium terrae]MBB6072114.1 hypothetical protein [Longimicrobium terrae]NNC29804.1 nuclear transport factor 2 family protein [Longimicrobium terrae]
MRISLLALVLLCSTAAHAQSGAAPLTTDPLSVVRENVAAQSAHDLDRFLATFADTVEYHIQKTGPVRDSVNVVLHHELRSGYGQVFKDMPDTRFEILDEMVSGSIVVTTERITGFPGYASLTGVAVYRVRNGRIDALWTFSTGENPGF